MHCVGLIEYIVCPGSSDPFYIVAFYIKWVTTSWTDGIMDKYIETKIEEQETKKEA